MRRILLASALLSIGFVQPSPAQPVQMAQADAGHAGHGAHSPSAPAAGSATVGNIVVSGGFARAMLPGQKVGGGYASVTNTGLSTDRLLSASTPGATGGQLHEMAMAGDVMTMRPLENGIEIPAGGTVELQPGGLHLMFTGVSAPFKEGQSLPVTLTFEKAGKIEVVLPVLGAAAKGGSGEHGGHEMHGADGH